MKLRPHKYAEAYDSIEKQYGRCNMKLLYSSHKNAAELIGEEPDEKIIFPRPEEKTTITKYKDDNER